MTPKKITKGSKSQATTSASAQPSSQAVATTAPPPKPLSIIDGKVQGDFNFTMWNERACTSQMHWGGAVVEEYLMGSGIRNP